MIQEGSTIAKAIDKAWQDAGKPSEFTIKIMQTEERNFFGMVRKPAVVSIVYEPRNVQDGKPSRATRPESRESRGRERGQEGRRHSFDHKNYEQKSHEPRQQREQQREAREARVAREAKNEHKEALIQEQHLQRQQQRSVAPRDTAQMDEGRETWSQPQVEQIAAWLKDILGAMQIATPFGVSVERTMLRIEFKERVLESADEEHLFFSSLVAILMQFLRHKEKKRLGGLRISICANR
jgi:predicted RNA-binding protein Jag